MKDGVAQKFILACVPSLNIYYTNIVSILINNQLDGF